MDPVTTTFFLFSKWKKACLKQPPNTLKEEVKNKHKEQCIKKILRFNQIKYLLFATL